MSRGDIAGGAHLDRDQPYSEKRRRLLGLLRTQTIGWIDRIPDDGNGRGCRDCLLEQRLEAIVPKSSAAARQTSLGLQPTPMNPKVHKQIHRISLPIFAFGLARRKAP
jgi:hypothetical protein